MTDVKHAPAVKPGRTMMVSNILAIVGSIILIIIIIWGLLHLLSISGGFFSSLFSNKADTKITITAPATVTAGEPVKVSWKHKTKEKGSYALMYPCAEGLRFSTRAANDAFLTMPCGSAFSLDGAKDNATILPMLAGTSSARIPLSVLFIPSATGTPAEGTVTMTVNAGKNQTPVVITPGTTTTPVKPVEPTPVKPTTPTKPVTPSTPVVTGPADLAVTITSVIVDAYGNGTATFNISNVGGRATGSYHFTAELPTAQPYTYVSPVQASLAPGSYIVNTLRFTQAISGNLYVAVDELNAVPENNEYNNTAMQYVVSQYQNQYPREYGPYIY